MPALYALGIDAWSLPTVIFSETPGRGKIAGGAVPDELLGSILGRVQSASRDLGAVHVGYLRTAQQGEMIAGFLRAAKSANQRLVVSVDPIMGDAHTGLYIPEAAAEALARLIVPQADILTPNQWELERLTGRTISGPRDVLLAAESLGCRRLVCTSVPGRDESEIATVLAENGVGLIARERRVAHAPHGTGDLFAALFLGHVLKGEGSGAALGLATASVHRLIEAASEMAFDQLPVIERADLLRPSNGIDLRLLSGAGDSPWVAGADGCRGGWVVGLTRLDGKGEIEVRLCRDFSEILALPEAPRVIALDCPIGLPQRAIKGGREACNQARARLGGRQSSVFSVPARAALHAASYVEACALNLENSDPPRKIAKQSFNILPRIAEVDALMTPDLQRRAFECHPELAFWAMNGERVLDLPKKVKSRPFKEGMALRRHLLAEAGLVAPAMPAAVSGISPGEDDLLDACACTFSARRIALGEARRFPADPPRDEKDLRMEILA